MIVYAVKTWKYIAFPALLFLMITVFLFANAFHAADLLNKDVKENGRVTCVLDDQSDEEIVTQLLKTGKGSFVYEAETRFFYQAAEHAFGVTGINGNMLTGNIICGTCYEDNNSALLLVVNRAVMYQLTGKVTVEPEDLVKWIDQSLVMGENAAKIRGVIEDDSEIPMVYISIAAAEKYLKQIEEGSYVKSYCIMTSDLECIETLQKEMNKNGIVTSIDQQNILEWKLDQIKINNQIIMGVIALLGFVSSIRLTVKMKRQQEVSPCRGVMLVRIIVNVCVGIVGGLFVHGFVRLWIIQ